MGGELKVLPQEEGNAVSHVVAGGQSSESAEQEGGVQKIADIDTDKMEAPQDCDNSPEQPMKNQMDCPISIDSVTLLDGGSPIIKLRIKNLFSKNIAYAEVKYETLSPSTIKKCVTENGGMFQDWKNLLVTLLREIDMGTQYNLIPIIHGHTKVGWSENTNGIIFYHQNMTSQDNHNSQYMGKMDIKPKGKLENIVNMIRRWILSTSEWSPLEAVIAFSISSVVLGYAKFAWGKVINNLVIHLVGDSTSGKTTSLRLHVGLGSNPYEEKYGFWLNHQSSIEAMIRKIGDNQGLPVGIDELSSARKKEYTDFIYTFGNGDEKDRLKAGGTGLCA